MTLATFQLTLSDEQALTLFSRVQQAPKGPTWDEARAHKRAVNKIQDGMGDFYTTLKTLEQDADEAVLYQQAKRDFLEAEAVKAAATLARRAHLKKGTDRTAVYRFDPEELKQLKRAWEANAELPNDEEALGKLLEIREMILEPERVVEFAGVWYDVKKTDGSRGGDEEERALLKRLKAEAEAAAQPATADAAVAAQV